MGIRPRLSPTIDGLLGAQFLGPFLVCLGAFTIAYLLGDVFDRFNHLLHYGGFRILRVPYLTLTTPPIISQLPPPPPPPRPAPRSPLPHRHPAPPPPPPPPLTP